MFPSPIPSIQLAQETVPNVERAQMAPIATPSHEDHETRAGGHSRSSEPTRDPGFEHFCLTSIPIFRTEAIEKGMPILSYLTLKWSEMTDETKKGWEEMEKRRRRACVRRHSSDSIVHDQAEAQVDSAVRASSIGKAEDGSNPAPPSGPLADHRTCREEHTGPSTPNDDTRLAFP